MESVSAAERRPRARVRLDVLEWDGPDLLVGTSAELVRAGDGSSAAGPLLLRREQELLVDSSGVDWTPVLDSAGVEVLLRDRAAGEEHPLPVLPARVELLPTADDRLRLVVRSEARLSTVTGQVVEQLAQGLWDVFVRLTFDGTSYDVRLGKHRGPDLPAIPPAPSLVGRTLRTVSPYWTDKGNLSLAVDRQPPGRGVAAASADVQRRATAACLRLVLPLRGPESVDGQVRVRLSQEGRPAVELPGRLRHAAGARTSELEVVVPLMGGELRSGTWRVHLLLAGGAVRTDVALELLGVAPAALVRVEGGAAPSDGNPVIRAAEMVTGFAASLRRFVSSL